MSVFLLCALQVTLVLAVALMLSRLLLQRAPALAAEMGVTGMLGSALLVLIVLADIPRPFTTSMILGSDGASVSRSQDINLGRVEATETMAQAQPAANFQWRAILDSLNRISHSDSTAAMNQMARTTLWYVGFCLSLAMFCRILIGTYAVAIAEKGSKRLCNRKIDSTIATWRDQLRITNPIEVRICPSVPSPCVTWLRRGTVLVPDDFMEWSWNDQRTTLAHEMQHILRHDALLRLCVDVLHIAACFHPLSYVLRKQIVLAQELATDHGAMALMDNQNNYQAGLASLALRIDSRATSTRPTFGVSVSTNDLIRRIKMLSSVSSPLPKWQKASAVFVMASALTSVALVSTADDALRIASLAKSSQTPAERSFQRPASRPWEVIGPSDSYLRMDLAELKVRDEVLQSLKEIEGAFVKEKDGFSRGLLADSVQVFQSDLHMATKRLAQPNDQGHEWQLTQTFEKFHIRFDQPIQWASIAKALDWEWLGSPESELTKRMRADVLNIGESKVLDLALGGTLPTPVNPELSRRLWKRIDGGTVGAVWRVDASFQTKGSAEADKSGLLKLLQSCQAVAVGLDFDARIRTANVRIVIAPNEGQRIEDVQSQVEAFRGFYKKAIADQADLEVTNRRLILEARVAVETLDDDGTEVIVITGRGESLMIYCDHAQNVFLVFGAGPSQLLQDHVFRCWDPNLVTA
ncbi:Regulatory protein BlaR1 [Rubripirellula tenax]|uniref:Regulatory protein BlaR1 n=1 Tax=Rubripirellula tenax TaxID=2528015 RepID=A0A5C6FCS7_9BACT|nr:Regulatory protein BlaR1 [Rubripirellula tenax]